MKKYLLLFAFIFVATGVIANIEPEDDPYTVRESLSPTQINCIKEHKCPQPNENFSQEERGKAMECYNKALRTCYTEKMKLEGKSPNNLPTQ
ncbi:MAG: hypothetical protein FWG80_04630 [Alphaproteobacteria bacterium]|nr:hypothetical protein [Alphaproteobacteria bacterium]